MNFKLGKEYIVKVSEEGGIISIEEIGEFDPNRFYDKDHDDLDFLTDEEKARVVNDALSEIRAEIEDLPYEWWEDNPKSAIDDVLQIFDKYGKSEKDISE